MSGKWPHTDVLSLSDQSILFCWNNYTTSTNAMFIVGFVYLVDWEPRAGSLGRKSRVSNALGCLDLPQHQRAGCSLHCYSSSPSGTSSCT